MSYEEEEYNDIDFNDIDQDAFEDEIKYGEERAVFERTAFTDPFDDVFKTPFPDDEKKIREWLRTLSPVEKFYYKLKVEVIPKCKELYGKINVQDIISKAKRESGLQYKNAWCFILGYIAIKNGEITKKSLDTVYKNLPQVIISENGIEKADIVRYSRFWLND